MYTQTVWNTPLGPVPLKGAGIGNSPQMTEKVDLSQLATGVTDASGEEGSDRPGPDVGSAYHQDLDIQKGISSRVAWSWVGEEALDISHVWHFPVSTGELARARDL